MPILYLLSDIVNNLITLSDIVVFTSCWKVIDMETIGSRFKHLRKIAGLSQFDFAKAIGLSQGRLSDIETNQNKPSADTLMAVNGCFGASTDWLLQGIGLMPTESVPLLKEEKSISGLETNEAAKLEIELSDQTFLRLIYQLNDSEKHHIYNFIHFSIKNRSTSFKPSQHED
jgi:transcriptional regulator with XRE-family HTH domain